jgi:hypothetical protein
LVLVGGNSTFRVDLSTFTRIGDVTAPESTWSEQPTWLQSFPQTILGLDVGSIDVFPLQTSPFSIGVPSSVVGIPHITDMTSPSVAFAGSRFLVGASAMTPTFVDDSTATRTPLDAIGIGGQVGSDSTSFLVTQETGGAITARTVSPAGTIGATNTLASPGGYYGFDPKLTGNGRYYLLTGRDSPSAGYPEISAVRIAADGTFADNGQGVFHGTNYGVLADTTPPPTQRTFGIFATMTYDLQCLRLRSESGVLITPAEDFGGGGYSSAQATDGTSFMVAYQTFNGSIVQSFMALSDPASGSELASYPVERPELSPGTIRGAWFDGQSYLVGISTQDASVGDPNAAFLVWRYASDLTARDTAGIVAIPDKFAIGFTGDTAMARDGNGVALLVYPYADYRYGGVTMRGVFLHDTP